MIADDNTFAGWDVCVCQKNGAPDTNQICLRRKDNPHINLEVVVPALDKANGDVNKHVMIAIQDAIDMVQEAIDAAFDADELAPEHLSSFGISN